MTSLESVASWSLAADMWFLWEDTGACPVSRNTKTNGRS